MIREFFLNSIEYCTDGFSWLRRKLGFTKDEDLSESYAGRQFGMWAGAFNQNNVRWINRIHAKLVKAEPRFLEDEPGIQELLDQCQKRGLCSKNLYNALRQYGNRENGLPTVINLQPAP